MSEVKIYRVECTLTPKKFEVKAEEMQAKETPKLYFIKRDWGTITVRKSNLMKFDCDPVRRFLYNRVYYKTFCLEQDVEEAKKKVFELVYKDFETMYLALDKMHDLYLDIHGHM